jgi:predicted O-methyltransferase YrrM
MSFKDRLRWSVQTGVAASAKQWQSSTRDSRNVELVLNSLFVSPGLPSLHFPVQFVELVRGCIEGGYTHSLRELKVESQIADLASKRFATLKDELLRGLPPIELSVASEIAQVADRSRSLSDSLEVRNWAGDIGTHFDRASSFARKGRILYNAIRFMRCERCLELGTAYGMSALFILAALKKYSPSGSLATVEGWEKLAAISSAILKQRYADMVSCHTGAARTVLPELTKSLGRIDFLFHDSGHSRSDYINDFESVVNNLAPGAVVLFDDIRWDSPRFTDGDPDTYGGWKAVVATSRVRQAVEIDDSLGLLLIN